ncbi:hypothetical protein X975_16471, partial [Stegodyphus mimosarum]
MGSQYQRFKKIPARFATLLLNFFSNAINIVSLVQALIVC